MKWNELEIKEIERLTEHAVRIDFITENNSEFNDFKSGQFITIRKSFDGELINRSYSICSAPNQDSISIGIKEIPNGLFSTYANRELKVGDRLECLVPQGKFTIPEESRIDGVYVFFAAGSGITPILSMMKSCLSKTEDSEVVLFYGNKNIRSIMFLEEIEGLKNKYLDRIRVYHVLSRQEQDSELLSGHIDAEKISRWNNLFVSIEEAEGFYLCGPEKMITNVSKSLKEYNVDPNKIHFELFTSALAEEARTKRKMEQSNLDSNKDAPSVIMRVDGKDTRFKFTEQDDNLLDSALQHGADLPFACKGGVCCTCKARVKEGTVKMYVNYGLEPDEIENNFVLTCQAYPTSDSVVVDFDDV